MSQLKTEFDALLLDLTLHAAFKYIMENVTVVVTTSDEYVKTQAELLGLSFEANDEDGLPNYLNQVMKKMRQLAVLNNGKAYDSELIVAQCQSKIGKSGIYKQELRKIDKDWTKEDQNADTDTKFKRFKLCSWVLILVSLCPFLVNPTHFLFTDAQFINH